MSFTISRLYALPPFVKKKKKKKPKKTPVVENMLYSFLQEKNIYIDGMLISWKEIVLENLIQLWKNIKIWMQWLGIYISFQS